jgi:hypothetical protein
MSRSGYSDEYDPLWRGAVTSAIRGRRGQAFLKELLTAMDTVADGKLIANDLEAGGAVCALGAVGKARGLNLSEIDADAFALAPVFGISYALAAEITFENDEGASFCTTETPEARFCRMRKWVETHIRSETP